MGLYIWGNCVSRMTSNPKVTSSFLSSLKLMITTHTQNNIFSVGMNIKGKDIFIYIPRHCPFFLLHTHPRCQPVRSLRVQDFQEWRHWHHQIRGINKIVILKIGLGFFEFWIWNLQDFLQSLSQASRGTIQEKLRWIFGLYDLNGDGYISKAEMTSV